MAVEREANIMNKLVDMILEKTILSGIMKHGSNGMAEVDDIISNDSFSHTTHQKLYFVLHNLIYKDKCEKLDMPTVIVAANALGFRGCNENLLQELSNQSVGLENLRKHAFGLFRLKFARELMDKLNEATVELAQCSSETTVSKISGIVEDKLFGSIASLDTEIGTINILKNAKEYLDFIKSSPKGIVGVPTGFQRYDAAIGGGLRPATINLIGARPKTGKSFVCLNMLFNIANAGIPVLYLDTELTHTQHQMPRMLALLAGINRQDIETGKFAEDMNANQLVYEASELDLPIEYKSVGNECMSAILSIIRRWLVKHVGFQPNGMANSCVIVYDFIKSSNADSSNLSHEEHQVLGDMMQQMSNFLKKYQIACLMMSQVNRLAIEKPGQGTTSGSDRLEVFCESYAVLGDKVQEDLGQDGYENGDLKMTLVYTRSGAGLKKGNYINIKTDLATSKVTEGPLFSEVIEAFE